MGLDQLWQLILSWRIKMHLNRSSCKMILKFNINICVCGNAYILLFSKSLSSISRQIKILYKHWQLIQMFAYNSHTFNQLVSTFQIIKANLNRFPIHKMYLNNSHNHHYSNHNHRGRRAIFNVIMILLTRLDQ